MSKAGSWVSDPEDEPIHDITGAREAAATTGTLIVADRGYQRWGNKPTNRHPTSMRSLLTRADLWGRGRDHNGYHASIRVRSEHGIRTLICLKVLQTFIDTPTTSTTPSGPLGHPPRSSRRPPDPPAREMG